MNNKKLILLLAFGILLVGILFFVKGDFIDDKYILLELEYDNGEISLLSKSLEIGEHPEILHEVGEEYKIDLISDVGSVLYSEGFDPTKLFTDFGDEDLKGGLVELNEVVFYMAIPDYKESEKIEILKDNVKIFETGVYDVGAKSCRIK